MTGSAAAAARMTKGRQADSGRRRERVLNALAEMARNAEAVTISALARRAGVDRSFLYRHPDLLAQAANGDRRADRHRWPPGPHPRP
jgi:DNA-binding IclR family transcriptional regulator